MIATLWHVGGQTAFREGIRLNSASGICGTCRSRPGDIVGTPAKQPSEGVARLEDRYFAGGIALRHGPSAVEGVAVFVPATGSLDHGVPRHRFDEIEFSD
jgi:hypothetical protein